MKKILYFNILFFSLIFFIFISLADSVEYNALNIELPTNKYIFSFFPQGWAFFTKDPREPQSQLFKLENNKWQRVEHYQSSMKNYLGMNKGSTRINYELISIYSLIKKTEYSDSYSNIQIGWIENIPTKVIYIKNSFDNPRLRGEYALVIQKIVPWAWSKNLNNEQMPCKIAHLKIY